MNRRYTLALVAAAALLLGSTQLSAHDDKIHKATIGEVTAANSDGLSAPFALDQADQFRPDGAVGGQTAGRSRD